MGKETGGQRGEERDGERSMNGLTKKTGEVVKFSLMDERVDNSKVFKVLMSRAEEKGLSEVWMLKEMMRMEER
jgi:hypothetical protein